MVRDRTSFGVKHPPELSRKAKTSIIPKKGGLASEVRQEIKNYRENQHRK